MLSPNWDRDSQARDAYKCTWGAIGNLMYVKHAMVFKALLFPCIFWYTMWPPSRDIGTQHGTIRERLLRVSLRYPVHTDFSESFNLHMHTLTHIH